MADRDLARADLAIRPLRAADLPGLRTVIADNGLFPPEMLDGMVAGYLDAQGNGEIWLTAERGHPLGPPVGLAYCAPERMTKGTWNLLLIAVAPDAARRGIGEALVRAVERALTTQAARVLLVETSGLPAYAAATAFYHHLGFEEEGRIRGFYAPGEDKVIFWKELAGAPRSGPPG